MHLELKSVRSGLIYPSGTLDWNEHTGEFAGELAAIVRAKAEEYGRLGEIEVLQPGGGGRPFAYPVRDSEQLAALFAVMGYRVPKELGYVAGNGSSAEDRDQIVY